MDLSVGGELNAKFFVPCRHHYPQFRMTKKITTPYFPTGLKLVAPILFFVGLYLCFASHPIWGVILMVLCVVIFTTNYVTAINLESKTYSDYLSIAGISMNKESGSFKTLDRIVITKGNYSQTVNTRVQSRQMDWSDYTATLLIDEAGILDLLTRTKKKELILELKDLAEFLKIGMEDQTTNQHYWIDLSAAPKSRP